MAESILTADTYRKISYIDEQFILSCVYNVFDSWYEYCVLRENKLDSFVILTIEADSPIETVEYIFNELIILLRDCNNIPNYCNYLMDNFLTVRNEILYVHTNYITSDTYYLDIEKSINTDYYAYQLYKCDTGYIIDERHGLRLKDLNDHLRRIEHDYNIDISSNYSFNSEIKHKEPEKELIDETINGIRIIRL
jgi:hypothetical protein